MEEKLTIIIPFLNEGIEVRNTLSSLVAHCSQNINIILINDASDDNYDYNLVAQEFNTLYIHNKKRLGVAASRDLGVDLCQTPYFLFLDAHMRFYNNAWSNIIIKELQQNDRALLCCQTKVLRKENENTKEEDMENLAFGANLHINEDDKILQAEWKYEEYYPEKEIEAIPCILGAAYAASKRYWKYLKGLKGLQQYGSDEVYISLKTWLEGGQCLLLKNIVIGHIYRKAPPYTLDTVYTVYNKLWIAELLLTEPTKDRTLILLQNQYKDLYHEAYLLLKTNQKEIKKLKKYYQKIFTKSFDSTKTFFSSFLWNEEKEEKKKLLLERIANHILLNSSFLSDIGLLNGKIGLVIFFSHYAKFCKDERYEEFAGELLDELYGEIHTGIPLTFNKGLYGIGWGIEYLVQRGFMEGDTDEILEDIDRKIMERDPLRMEDYSLQTGLGGLIHYVVARLSAQRDENAPLPFDNTFLNHLSKVAHNIINDNHQFENQEIARRYLKIIKKKDSYSNPLELFNTIIFRPPSGDDITHWSIGLEGCAGKGLKMMTT